MSTYSTFAASGGSDGPAGGGGGLVTGTTSYVVCADSNRSLAICLTCECPSGNITLPNATSLSPGSPTYVIKNENTNTTFLLRDNTSCVLTSIPPGGAVDASLYDNSAQQGEWVIGKFSKPTPFNPLSDIDIFTGGALANTETNFHDCCQGFSAVTYDFPTCCYKAVTFKTVSGEYTKVGEINGTVCKCNFGVAPAHNGFVIYGCKFCQCDSALVDYAKFITAINCDSTCAVTFINCCDVGCCNNSTQSNGAGTAGCWMCFLTEGTSMLQSFNVFNENSRCGSVSLAKICTTTTGAPTCHTCIQCIQTLVSCSAWTRGRQQTICQRNTLCYDRPKCCASVASLISFRHNSCYKGSSVYLVHLKGNVCYIFGGENCNILNNGTSGATDVSGEAYFICDQLFMKACISAPSCTNQFVKVNHCGNGCCICNLASWTSQQCGILPVGLHYFFLAGCCRCITDTIYLKCACQNCVCKVNLTQGSNCVICLNYNNLTQNRRCNDAMCLFVGMPAIDQNGNNHWGDRDRNDQARKTRNTSGMDYCKYNDLTAVYQKSCDNKGESSAFVQSFDNAFFLYCDTLTCLAGFIVAHDQNGECLKLKKFHLNTSHNCQTCCFKICLPTAFIQAEYYNHCICNEHNGFKYWNCATCRLCSYNVARGLATMWCITGACNQATVCCMGTTSGNSFAGAKQQCECSCGLFYNQSNTRWLNTVHNVCGGLNMQIMSYNMDTFPGAIFCCIVSKTTAGRKWQSGYSASMCRLLMAGEQWICSSVVFTNLGLIHGIYNPSNNCYSTFNTGITDAVQGSIQGTIPHLDTLTICQTNKNITSFIKGKD